LLFNNTQASSSLAAKRGYLFKTSVQRINPLLNSRISLGTSTIGTLTYLVVSISLNVTD